MKTILALLAFTALVAPSAQASINDQANRYSNLLGEYGGTTQIMRGSPLHRGGEMRPKTLLRGVLYFGGSDRRRDTLTSGTLGYLCDAGFSTTYSVYDEPGRNSVSCGGNTMRYQKVGQASSRNNGGSKVRRLMENVHQVIKAGGSRGPIYLHCWYGVHASNTIAQMVLKQFCQTSSRQLESNWHAVDIYSSLGREGTRRNIAKVNSFQPYSDLTITADERRAVCY